MATRAIKPKRDDDMLTGWESSPETAPSIEREDSPTAARVLALIGLFLLALGGFAVIAPLMERSYLISPAWGVIAVSFGLPLLLFHAFIEKDTQFRSIYAFFAAALLLVGLVLGVLAFAGKLNFAFLAAGFPSLFMGLILAIAFLRNERNEQRVVLLRGFLGGIAALLILTGILASFLNQDLLLGRGLVQMLLGLAFFAAFVAFQNDADGNVAHGASLALGVLGCLLILVSLGRSYFDSGIGPSFFLPTGLVLLGVGLLYLITALAVGSDWTPIVLFRRELAAFFYSPIAHLVLFGMGLLAWLQFSFFFISNLLRASRATVRGGASGFPEPIVTYYIFDLFPVLANMFLIPILSMRLFSEEKRSGTLEVLLTAPVRETSVVLSKFFSVLVFYLLAWVPFWLYLVALRVVAGVPFDFFPLFSFFLTLAATGAAFLAVGLFFSSITRNQIIAAVLTLVFVMFQWMPYARGMFRLPEGSLWNDILQYVSYLDLWNLSLFGVFAPRFLMFHVSVAFFFLFLSVKVLESRKWK